MLALLDPDDHSTEYHLLLASDLSALKDHLAGVLPQTAKMTRTRIAKYLHYLSLGYFHRAAAKRAKIKWASFATYCAKYPKLQALYRVCKDYGEDVRQALREEELHKRALQGFLEPVFQKGKKVGVIRKFNFKYLELALKGGDKDGKYVDRKQVEHSGSGGLQITINNFPARGSVDGPKTINITPDPAQNATKTQPEPLELPENPTNTEDTTP